MRSEVNELNYIRCSHNIIMNIIGSMHINFSLLA